MNTNRSISEASNHFAKPVCKKIYKKSEAEISITLILSNVCHNSFNMAKKINMYMKFRCMGSWAHMHSSLSLIVCMECLLTMSFLKMQKHTSTCTINDKRFMDTRVHFCLLKSKSTKKIRILLTHKTGGSPCGENARN